MEHQATAGHGRDQTLVTSLFEDTSRQPLAERMRPDTLERFVGQDHITGPGKPLRQLIEQDRIPSLIFWGPPGCGKTTLAHIIARATRSRFVFFSAIMNGIKEVRDLFKEAEQHARFGTHTILFVDEIHRFNKAQQDAFLPAVESGLITLIGATTENPSFEVIAPLLSRCRVLRLHPLPADYCARLLDEALRDREHGLGLLELTLDDDARTFITEAVQGDARKALNTLELAASLSGADRRITCTILADALQHRPLLYDKGGDGHYEVISAFIKSLRGSDPDAGLYWLARLLEAGEDPRFIIRRMLILAAEDIGNADPRALQVVTAAASAFEMIGMPEGRIILGQAVTYLATAPKSNASYLGIDAAIAEVRASGSLPVPTHLRNAPTALLKQEGYGAGYQYSHDFDHSYSDQQFLPERLTGRTFYQPRNSGYEKNVLERMAWLKQQVSRRSS